MSEPGSEIPWVLGSVSLVDLNLFNDVPDGLTRRPRSFVRAHGVKVDIRPVEEHRQRWLERDVPAAVIDRMARYEERWGGLVPPPSPQYDGGPRYLEAGSPEGGLSDTWWRGAGSLVAVYTGEAEALCFPRGRTAFIYSGMDEWGLRGGVKDSDS
jgi:hypothetical protein